MKQYVIINGDMIAKDDASIQINDLGLLRGYGIFDFFRTINSQPVWIEDHLDRFYFSAAEMAMPVPLDRSSLKDMIRQLMEKNHIPDSGIRLLLTGGYSEDGYSFQKPNLFITQGQLIYNKDNFEKGIRLVTYEHQRQLAHIKTTDYLQAIRLQQYVKDKGAQDILYHHHSALLENPRSNFFIVNDRDEILTPVENILRGINRKKVLEMTGFNFRETLIDPKDLMHAKEAFITSTIKTVLPVLNIDGRDIGNGKPGEITRQVWEQLLKMQRF